MFAAIEDVENKVKRARDDWIKELEYAAIFKKHQSDKSTLGPTEEWILKNEHYRKPDVEGKRPKCLLVVDDCSHSKIFSSGRANPFVNLCLRHRHLHDVGLSIFLLLQNQTGLPRALRLNTMQYALWRTQDTREIKSIFEEVGGVVNWNTFIRLYDYATRDSLHDFLFIDLNAIDPNLMFRKNLDERILLDESESSAPLLALLKPEKEARSNVVTAEGKKDA